MTRNSKMKTRRLKGTSFADTSNNKDLAFDNKYSTIYTSSNSNCYFGLDLGQNYKGSLFKIMFFLNKRVVNPKLFAGATVQVSTDGTNYTTLFNITGEVHSNWNTWKTQTLMTDIYRYVKFSHNSTSGCRIS